MTTETLRCPSCDEVVEADNPLTVTEDEKTYHAGCYYDDEMDGAT